MGVKRTDRVGSNRTQFEKNARYIYRTQDICGICGLPVDKELKSPDPMSKTIDHIIPVSKGGHPSDLANLQLAHRCCNRQKGDKLFTPGMLNTQAIQKPPGGIKHPGQTGPDGENAPESLSHLEIQPATDNPDQAIQSRGHGSIRRVVDNDNLPQHADWSAMNW